MNQNWFPPGSYFPPGIYNAPSSAHYEAEIERLRAQIAELRMLFVSLILTLMASWVATWLVYHFLWAPA